ncbi:MAG: paraquat-inducible protein A [Polyangiaceae bacterium]
MADLTSLSPSDLLGLEEAPPLEVKYSGADLLRLRECRDCGLYQRLPEVPDGEEAKCVRCFQVLRRAQAHLVPLSLASAVLAAFLFLFSLFLPFFVLRAAGRHVESTLFTGPQQLENTGLPILATIVLMMLVVAPALKLTIHIGVLVSLRFAPDHPSLPYLFGWRAKLAPWAMLDVFLLGAFVAYTRLVALAQVEIGTANYAIFGAMLAGVAADASLDTDWVWEHMDQRTLVKRDRVVGHGVLIGCHTCGLVCRVPEKSKCPRCRHVVHARKTNGVMRSFVMLLTGILLYLPANTLPVMDIKKLGKGGPSTILNGVKELAEAHLWPLALLVLLASIIIPVVKIVGLSGMLAMTRLRSTRWLLLRTRAFRVIHAIGRWSMIDIFMLTTLVGVVKLGFLATVLPGPGAFAFCCVVIFTMFATEVFDPRSMWDAVQLNGTDVEAHLEAQALRADAAQEATS